MKRLKKIQAAHYIGIVFIISGLLNERFMIVRPNRIENGNDLNIFVAIKGNLPLMATLFIMLFILLLAIVFIYAKHKVSYELPLMNMSAIGLYLFMTGRIATMSIVSLSSSARASLGIGFWLIFIGLILLTWQTIQLNEGYKLWMIVGGIVMMIMFYNIGWLDDISVIKEFSNKSDRIGVEVIRHMQLTFAASMTGLILSLILSYTSYRIKKVESLVSGIANFAQVVPTLSLLGLLMIPLAFLASNYPVLKNLGVSGIGFFPAYVVLTLYTLLPIISNTLAGFKSIPDHVIEAALGMGMNRKQLLWRVELPMVFPSIFVGFRIALVQTVGNCILAGLVGGGGIGTILFLGLAQSAPDLVLVASLIVVMIAVVFELVLTTVEKRFIQKVRGELVHD